MPFNKLISGPRVIPGGIAFTINEVSLGQLVVIADGVLDAVGIEPSSKARVAAVMYHIQALSDLAVRKAQPFDVPELIVLEEDDLRALPDLLTAAIAPSRSEPRPQAANS